ncbi:hypothetical protein RN51_01108 [Microbacterium oxydans]|uniref:Uncharacterized protein n=1 Tax=Microbacterium oxydans TaxID=82380 RepID=A0A0F0KWN2_9MICO|nr:hypothetical protein [Microbacterium oxydans]KJL24510.1 hypothetical protein RN51_01108 [Microbacterium oxydans]
MLLIYLTAMRMDGCVSSCRDDVANFAADGLKVVLIVLVASQVLLFVFALLRRTSPHIIGAVMMGLSLVAITAAYLLMVSAYPVSS